MTHSELKVGFDFRGNPTSTIVRAMPLSDHEKRLLAEMEEALAADDPRLISTFKGKTPNRSRAVVGFLLVVSGLFVLLAGLVGKTPLLGIFGFAIALGGSVLALSNLGGWRCAPKPQEPPPNGAPGLKSDGIVEIRSSFFSAIKPA